jgi:hypothetical protein
LNEIGTADFDIPQVFFTPYHGRWRQQAEQRILKNATVVLLKGWL